MQNRLGRLAGDFLRGSQNPFPDTGFRAAVLDLIHLITLVNSEVIRCRVFRASGWFLVFSSTIL